MVAMHMRDQNDVDRLRVDAGCGQGRGQQADRGTETGTIAGIDQHELGAGIDHDRIERRDDAALWHIGGLGGGEHLLVADIAARRWQGSGIARAPSLTTVTRNRRASER
jgi:hypothetical protein